MPQLVPNFNMLLGIFPEKASLNRPLLLEGEESQWQGHFCVRRPVPPGECHDPEPARVPGVGVVGLLLQEIGPNSGFLVLVCVWRVWCFFFSWIFSGGSLQFPGAGCLQQDFQDKK